MGVSRMPPASAQRPSAAQSQGPVLRQPLNSSLPVNEMLGHIRPGLRAQPWNSVLQGHLSGIPWSRPRKYHQTTPPAFPATNDLKLKTQNSEAGIPALKVKRVLVVMGGGSFPPHGYESFLENKWKIGFVCFEGFWCSFVFWVFFNKKKNILNFNRARIVCLLRTILNWSRPIYSMPTEIPPNQ